MRLLLAEDDPYLSAMLAKGLREHAYAVDIVEDGDKAVMQAALYDYDVVVLDVMMPKRDGFAVCRELRRRGSAAPVLMLTARDALEDTIEGLDAGADDYLAALVSSVPGETIFEVRLTSAMNDSAIATSAMAVMRT